MLKTETIKELKQLRSKLEDGDRSNQTGSQDELTDKIKHDVLHELKADQNQNQELEKFKAELNAKMQSHSSLYVELQKKLGK